MKKAIVKKIVRKTIQEENTKLFSQLNKNIENIEKNTEIMILNDYNLKEEIKQINKRKNMKFLISGVTIFLIIYKLIFSGFTPDFKMLFDILDLVLN